MYGKLFASMYEGTLVERGPWQALVTFQQMLILADRTGVVDMTAGALSRRTTIPIDIITTGITALEQTDPGSRTPKAEGRRILRLSEHRDWGWKIVNYEEYRKIRSEDERREYMRVFMAEKRQGQPKKTKKVNGRKPVLAELAHADADVEAVLSASAAQPPLVLVGGGVEGQGTPTALDIKSQTRAYYHEAYVARWGAPPLWDKKANSLIVLIVQRLGKIAPAVAQFYLLSNRGLYVSAKHDLTLLLRDANALQTEWATGRQSSDTESRQVDRTQANASAFLPLIEEARRAERE